MNASSDVHCRSNGPELIAGFISPYRRRVRSLSFLVSYPNHQQPPFFFCFLVLAQSSRKSRRSNRVSSGRIGFLLPTFLFSELQTSMRGVGQEKGPRFCVCVSSFDRAPSFIYNSRPGGKRSGKHLAPVLSIVLVIKQLPVDCSAAV